MKAKVPRTHGSHNATPESLSVGVRLPHNSSFDKWKYSFLSRKNPEVSNPIMVWQLLGLRGPGLLFFCSISLKFASWAKRAAGALAIMSAFHASGRKRAKGARLRAGQLPLRNVLRISARHQTCGHKATA